MFFKLRLIFWGLLFFISHSVPTLASGHQHCKKLLDKYLVFSGPLADNVGFTLLSYLQEQVRLRENNQRNLDTLANAFEKQMNLHLAMKAEAKALTRLQNTPASDTANTKKHTLEYRHVLNIRRRLEAEVAELVEGVPLRTHPHSHQSNMVSDLRAPLVVSFSANKDEHPYQVGLDLGTAIFIEDHSQSTTPSYKITFSDTYGSIFERLFEAEKLFHYFDSQETTSNTTTFYTRSSLLVEKEEARLSHLTVGQEYPVEIRISLSRDDFTLSLEIFQSKEQPNENP